MKRSKRRYLLLHIDSEGPTSQKDLLEAIWGAIMRLFGETGSCQSCMMLVHYDEDKKTAVIRVALNALQSVRASIASITRIAGRDAAVHVVAVSGTLKSLRE